MKIAVPNHFVRKNVQLFKKLVETKRSLEQKKKHYDVFVHNSTGEFCSIEEVGLDPKIWKKMTLHLSDLRADEKRCRLKISPQIFEKIDDSALEIIQETQQAFNAIFRNAKNAAEVVKKIPYLIFPSKSDELILAAWHEVDRFGAEKLLLASLPGTFLFRRDEYAVFLEENLKCKCFTLTYLDSDLKVVDRTIVHKGSKFLFYNDDPLLEGPCSSNLVGLIHTLSDKLVVALPVDL